MKSYKATHWQRKIAVKKKAIKRRKLVQSRVFFDVVLAVVFVLSLVYLLFLSKAFKISSFQISLPKEISKQEIVSIANKYTSQKFLFFIKKDNFFLLNSNAIRDEIANGFPIAGRVEVRKSLANVLFINVALRIPEMKWCPAPLESSLRSPLTGFASATASTSDCFLIDQQGVVFSSEKPESPAEKKLIAVYSEMPQKSIFSKAASDSLLERIRETQRMLEEKFGITEIIFFEKSNGFLNIKASEPGGAGEWQAYFNQENDLSADLNKLRLLLEKEITPEKRKTLQYIDLRFSKAYYK